MSCFRSRSPSNSDIMSRMPRAIAGWCLLLLPTACGLDSCPVPSLPEAITVPSIWYGVSTAPYQTEDPGDEIGEAPSFQTDWDLHYEAGKLAEPKGNGTWSYTETQRDAEALAWLGVSHYRFGVEWARIEPHAGEVNPEAVQHYVEFARDLREVGIVPVVCLWHWAFPSWLADLEDPSRHGWLHPLAQQRWVEYVRLMVRNLAPYVELYAPQNEPDIQSLAAFIFAYFPPGQTGNTDLYDRNITEAARAFVAAAEAIREVYPAHAGNARPPVKIMSIQAVTHWEIGLLDVFGLAGMIVETIDYRHTDIIHDAVDLIGFTYYGKQEVSIVSLLGNHCRAGAGASDLGILTYPEGLTRVIGELASRYGKPLVILENGIADATDAKRPVYLMAHLAAVQKAIDQGHNVLGYFHWTLADNFEWMSGYGPRFGLYAVDSETRALQPKPSAFLYRDLIAARGGVFRVPQSASDESR